ncbi:transcriptional regulator [Rhodococcus opacus PD630]|uniref:sigma-54-dependent Fis family transcriptional regulator n=1 Tax=Rhodococcus opacus TaxID=37919 RepID=UPI00029CC0AB|nr:helix-turn-helix domain-containing protein [Rhodococcus opacus]AHK31774.1 Acetoin dehydrogenase operon transcriptional activator AcoR [Rhodococcus opacus PD630]EHI45080.1 transcriptional regulator [Rhodococcus opacus PD630]UDG94285.1 GAF domain-containing protein [Rhodococcus opacus PD630]
MTSKDLQKARELFLADNDLDSSVRQPISYSWQRSKSLKVRPDQLDLPFVREPNLDCPLVAAAEPVLRQLADGLVDEPVSVILTSADGVILTRITASRRLDRTLDAVQLIPGYSYSEEFAGTNGIGTTLETRQPTLVTGAEHYADCLGQLACAGVPITHPMSGALVGALDLTGWVEDGGPLLATLAKSATAQIEGRLLAQASADQTALLNAYLKACRRSPQTGVLALGDDVILVNRKLRVALDAQDQGALLEHAVDLSGTPATQRHIVALPSGQTARLSSVEDFGLGARRQMALFYVHLLEIPTSGSPALESIRVLPGITGSSASWRRSCQQIARCAREQQWVTVSGETGSGRGSALKAVAIEHIPIRTRIFTVGELAGDSAALSALEQELGQERFSVILRDIDLLGESQQRIVADLIQGREHAGWIGATIGGTDHNTDLDTLILPHFSHTVTMPALRHRIDDLHSLVPHLLRQLGRGADLSLSPAAMRQLCKYSWPGNVTELRQVLHEVVQRQRSGVVEVEQLPPMCRALSRHTLTQIEALERDAIVRSLEENHGNKKAAATALGISRATIYRKIKEFGIDI